MAALFVAFDRYFGCSSGWTRYVAAELDIRRALQDFQLDWEAQEASWQASAPTAEQVQLMIARAKGFITQVSAVVQKETDAWITEFNDTLKQLDEAAKAKTSITALGAINVTVTNADQLDAGWDLTIDDGAIVHYIGKTAGAANITPGMHKLRTQGSVQGKLKSAEAIVNVIAGAAAKAEFTL
jgi:hypothetical protein